MTEADHTTSARIDPSKPWHAPCEDLVTLSPQGGEFRAFHVVKDSNDRLFSETPPAPLPKGVGRVMHVEVHHGDQAWNPRANNDAGDLIAGGWRAEAIGPSEEQGDNVIGYRWSTMLHPDYPRNPHVRDANAPDDRKDKPIWQVITQWHQGHTDRGGSPPVAIIIDGEKVKLHLHRAVEADEKNESIEDGKWEIDDLHRGKWHHFRAEIRWDFRDGTIKLWHHVGDDPEKPVLFKVNGQEVDQLVDRSTMFNPKERINTGTKEDPVWVPNDRPPEVYMKIGLYREGFRTEPFRHFVLWHDEVHRMP